VIVLGIDPGHSTGIAAYGPLGLYWARTITYGEDGAAVLEALRLFVTTHQCWNNNRMVPDVVAVIEEPAKPYFQRQVSQRANYRIAGNVGECRAKAHALAGMLRALGVEVKLQAPIRGGTKRRITVPMWTAMFPEYKGRTSNHARDAAVIAQREYQRRKFLPGEIVDQRLKERKEEGR